jgi:hypothetical protein
MSASSKEKGVWAMHGDYEGEKPIPDSYLVENLMRDASKGTFDGQHNDSLYHVGFYFGMLHGSILDPRSGQLRPDVTALVTFTHPDARRGYSVARHDHFYYADATYIQTESALLKELSDIAQDVMSYPDKLDSWCYALACILCYNRGTPLWFFCPSRKSACSHPM